MTLLDVKKRYDSQFVKVICPECGEEILSCELEDVEYIKTRRRTEIFIHKKCIKKGR